MAMSYACTLSPSACKLLLNVYMLMGWLLVVSDGNTTYLCPPHNQSTRCVLSTSSTNSTHAGVLVRAPLRRRGHRSQFILPTPLPGARYSLRLAIPSSLCLSYHSARPELQCGYPPFTAHPPCARRRRHRAVETLLICLGCILFSKCLSHFRISHISNRLFFLD